MIIKKSKKKIMKKSQKQKQTQKQNVSVNIDLSKKSVQRKRLVTEPKQKEIKSQPSIIITQAPAQLVPQQPSFSPRQGGFVRENELPEIFSGIINQILSAKKQPDSQLTNNLTQPNQMVSGSLSEISSLTSDVYTPPLQAPKNQTKKFKDFDFVTPKPDFKFNTKEQIGGLLSKIPNEKVEKVVLSQSEKSDNNLSNLVVHQKKAEEKPVFENEVEKAFYDDPEYNENIGEKLEDVNAQEIINVSGDLPQLQQEEKEIENISPLPTSKYESSSEYKSASSGIEGKSDPESYIKKKIEKEAADKRKQESIIAAKELLIYDLKNKKVEIITEGKDKYALFRGNKVKLNKNGMPNKNSLDSLFSTGKNIFEKNNI